MYDLDMIEYAGIAALIILLIIFELRDVNCGNVLSANKGYEYYTSDSSRVRIHKVFGSLYKIYVYGNCPVQTKQDRFGTYFTVRARSASSVEYIVDDIYQSAGW